MCFVLHLVFCTVTKELKQREFGDFEAKLNQQKQEWKESINIEETEEGERFSFFVWNFLNQKIELHDCGFVDYNNNKEQNILQWQCV